MKKAIRKIAGGMAVLTAIAMLGGCGAKKDPEAGKSEEVTKTVEASKSEEQVKKTDVPTLLWYIPGDTQTDLENINEAASRITEEKIGAKIKMQFINDGSYGEKLSMINAAGEDYDLCWVGYLSTYVDNVKQGTLLDITDMLESTPDLKAVMPESVWDSCKIEDRIYAVPNYQILCTTTGFSVNKELADKYNFDVSSITRTEDLEEFLQKVAENEKGIYPFRANWGVASFVEKGEAHTSAAKGQYLLGYVKEDGKVKVVPAYEYGHAKEKAKILYDWYQKGYIREDSASVTDDSQDARAGKYAVQATAYKPGVEAEDAIYMGGEVYSVSLSKPILQQDSARATMLGIGANSKHPEEAMKFIELINTDEELYNLICFGIEGKHYNKVGDNRIELVENSGYNPNAAWKFGNQFNAYLQPGQADDVWEQAKKINESAEKTPEFGFDPDYTDVKTQIAQCNTVIKEYNVMNKGALDPDEYFDEFEKKLYEAGLQDVLDEIQSQLDEFFKQ